MTNTADQRADEAYEARITAARTQREISIAPQERNGDEEAYPNHIASFSKSLPHNELGEVDGDAYSTLISAINSSQIRDFDALFSDASLRLSGPLGGNAYSMIGPDAHAVTIPPPPAFNSVEAAREMIELYWMAMLRDIPFDQYADNALVAAAVDDLSKLNPASPGGDNRNGALTPSNLFLANYPGVSHGPRVSQLLLWNFELDATPIVQRKLVPVPTSEQEGVEFMTAYDEWLAAQRGFPKGTSFQEPKIDPQPRYIITLRDMGWCADQSSINGTYLNAGLQLLQLGRAALSDANPYKTTRYLSGLASFDIVHLQSLLGQASTGRHCCYQKWLHRRLRPEAYSGRLHNHVTGSAKYPIHDVILHANILPRVYDHNSRINKKRGLEVGKGTYLLPHLWGSGCPTHPSYPQGHGTVAGVGVTFLKAWFDENFVLPEAKAVMPSPDGTRLSPYVYGRDGPPLTIGSELNKLVYNITWGRNMSGVHYTSDGIAANNLGEEIAIRILREDRQIVSEPFPGFSFTRFDGKKITA